ncbi:MAG: hypothetical protein ACOX0A_03250 [Thermoguttaceae bacterium]|jgi:hypothetical protein
MKRSTPSISSSATSSDGTGITNERRERFRLKEWCGSSLGSILLHVVALAILFFALGGGGHGGVGSRQTDEVGIVLSDSTDANSLDNASSNERSLEDETDPTSTQTETLTEAHHTALESFLPTNDIGLTSTTNSSSAQEAINAASGGALGTMSASGGQRVGFGGVSGAGKKFVYVIDRSDSMGWHGGAPMRRAILDAVASIQSLDPKRGATKFQVVVFNHDVEVFDSGVGLIDVTPPNKAKCVRFLQSVVPTGGTSPEQALAVGIKMRPDVVFFLTDADEELTEQTIERIKTLRRQCKVAQICVIEFRKSTDPPKKSYRRLAGENGGAYIFKDVDQF